MLEEPDILSNESGSAGRSGCRNRLPVRDRQIPLSHGSAGHVHSHPVHAIHEYKNRISRQKTPLAVIRPLMRTHHNSSGWINLRSHWNIPNASRTSRAASPSVELHQPGPGHPVHSREHPRIPTGLSRWIAPLAESHNWQVPVMPEPEPARLQLLGSLSRTDVHRPR
jgi:hypothetical protein